MKKALLSTLTVSTVLLGANVALGATTIVDDFTIPFSVADPSVTYDFDLSDSNTTTGATGSIIGGTRQTTLSILTGPPDPNDPNSLGDSTVLAIGSIGRFDQSVVGALGNFTRTTVTWNAGGAGLGVYLGPTSTTSFNRLRTTLGRFALNDPAAPNTDDIGAITVRVNGVGGNSQWTRTYDAISSPIAPLDMFYSEFTNPSVFNSNSTIDQIQLEVLGLKQGLLFTLDSLVAFGEDVPPPPISVPEPSLVIGCIALAGTNFALAGWKRYRNTRAK